MLTSSFRWRSERPPTVLLGEILHWRRILSTFTRPYFGTARSMSTTLAVSTNSGGWRSSWWIECRPAFRSRLSCARLVRISLARWSASMRWTSDRSGAAVCFEGEFVAGGMGGESTHGTGPFNGSPGKFGWTSTSASRLSRQVDGVVRSEEHTSELQSRQYLVCRLLLEKKKK